MDSAEAAEEAKAEEQSRVPRLWCAAMCPRMPRWICYMTEGISLTNPFTEFLAGIACSVRYHVHLPQLSLLNTAHVQITQNTHWGARPLTRTASGALQVSNKLYLQCLGFRVLYLQCPLGHAGDTPVGLIKTTVCCDYILNPKYLSTDRPPTPALHCSCESRSNSARSVWRGG